VFVGLTERVAGLLTTLLCVTPSDQVTVHGPTPVNAADKLKLPPTQLVELPLTVAVGGAPTVTTWLHVLVQPFALVIVTLTVNAPTLVPAVIETV
jgi:hypothetical protein